jgi:hypothetical protein
MKKILMTLAILSSPLAAMAADLSNGADNFYKSDKVTAQNVTFKNQYKMTVAGNLFIPKNPNKNKKIPRSLLGTPWVQRRSKVRICMPKNSPIRDSSLCPWICLSGERVRGSRAMPFCRIFMLKVSVLRWISLAPDHSSTRNALCSWDLR